MCIGCDKRLTIEHILLTCSDFIEIRQSHFTVKSLRMLFKDISPENIFYFLKEINIFGKIYHMVISGYLDHQSTQFRLSASELFLFVSVVLVLINALYGIPNCDDLVS